MTMTMRMGKREHRTLMNELAQGKELAQQLKNHLAAPSSSPETRQFLMEGILSCYKKAFSVLNCRDIAGGPMDEAETTFSFVQHESPASQAGDQYPNNVFKKRKTSSPRWTEEVRVVSGSGLEGPPGDGYNWRKYGQKDILGSIFPRAYYRCTHRHIQGCLATKQVQRSDCDPTVLEVTYRGRHTCIRSPSEAKDAPKQEEEYNSSIRTRTMDEQIALNHRSDLTVKTEENGTFPCFSFNPNFESDQNGETSIFGYALSDNSFLDSIALGTPEPGYLPVSTRQLSVLTTDSDLNEIVSAPASVTNSPIGDVVNFSLGKDLDFVFDDPNFFL